MAWYMIFAIIEILEIINLMDLDITAFKTCL